MASRVFGVNSGGTFTNLVPWEVGEVRTRQAAAAANAKYHQLNAVRGAAQLR